MRKETVEKKIKKVTQDLEKIYEIIKKKDFNFTNLSDIGYLFEIVKKIEKIYYQKN
jgi:mannose/fructose/N-acetylgalactosamine-specific phosphotransferase system component IID